MAGHFRLLIFASLAAAGSAAAQTPATPSPQPPPGSPPPGSHRPWWGHKPDGDHGPGDKGSGGPGDKPPGEDKPGGDPNSPEFANVRKALEALTPEQRARFIENFKRWANLSPEERKNLADRETFRRKKMEEDIDQAISAAGLQLEGERRAAFAKRYGEERRKLEEGLRKDWDEKRQPLLKELIAKLKTEFTVPTAVAAPTPPAQ